MKLQRYRRDDRSLGGCDTVDLGPAAAGLSNRLLQRQADRRGPKLAGGAIKVVPPPGEGIRLVRPSGAGQVAQVDCNGPCGTRSFFSLGVGTSTVAGVTSPGSGFDLPNRISKRFPLKLEFFCADSSGAEHLVGTSTLTLAFGKHGTVSKHGTLSYERSDLNGDGKPDGGQLH
jgi:hypothetical protein